MKRNHWIVLAVVAVVVVLAIALGLYIKNKKHKNQANNQNQQSAQVATSSPTSTPVVLKKNTSTAVKMPYSEAVKFYANRIQFNQCRGLVNITGTGVLAIKKGSQFMIDNRDEAGHTFAFKGESVKVPGFDYSVVTAAEVGRYPITCDGGASAELNVQN